MQILSSRGIPFKHPIEAQVSRATITEFFRRYRWSQRQVAERPGSKFEREVLQFNRQAVRLLIGDYQRRLAVADAREVGAA